ncbi:MAG: YaiI/YqxD family protein [Pirellulales bacterium]|jgi:uncharacterized protein YaiI (UPF0178 family)
MEGVADTQPEFHIWIDADACPRAIKEIIFKTSKRLKLRVTLVANQGMYSPSTDLINVITVPHGADVADDKIVSLVNKNDLVITGDIPLAARVVEKGALAIGTRGELFDANSVQGRLATRNLMEQFRSSGMETSGPKPINSKDTLAFANQLDRIVTRIFKTIK